MRRVLQILGTAALRSRIGIALVLVIVVLAVVGVARVFSGPEDVRTGAVGPVDTSTATSAAAPKEGDDGVVEPSPESSTALDPGPSLSPGARRPETVAEAFAGDWLDRTAKADAWYEALLINSTPTLAAKLKGVDPVVVPADRLTGPATVVPRGSGLVEVSYPVDSGTLLLRLVVGEGRWLVDGVDWERG
ncbi:hypothetical protein DFJ67_2587 [Asanoa ferruginea]|uniref:Uncharacterized protein n=1 Tax=Asanoa ferruginea TaxID=53367 RepID=A0A3D9ZGR5_9ACTN|nr:hypothetical protein [Asanoa ferruginea]REF96598.1 hypothetical protein DFJ67_2587 [Asanoa ferruginea]GIF49018.1 hypothetical protein Afe04nite_35570 [Asanoa ferruginea]